MKALDREISNRRGGRKEVVVWKTVFGRCRKRRMNRQSFRAGRKLRVSKSISFHFAERRNRD